MADAKKVTTGKPLIGGGIWAAPVGTALPTDATSKLDDAFKDLGYISEDGVTNNNAPDTDDVVAWGGDVVMSVQNSKNDTYQFTLIEATNVEALKTVYGEANVTGDLTNGIHIKASSDEAEERSYVIDMKMRGNVLKRIVIPDAKVSDLGEITYNNSDAVGYETTLKCMPGDDGATHHEYIIEKKPASTGADTSDTGSQTSDTGSQTSDAGSETTGDNSETSQG